MSYVGRAILGISFDLGGEVFSILKNLKETGITQSLVEQNAGQALDIADSAYVMEMGQIVEGERWKEY